MTTSSNSRTVAALGRAAKRESHCGRPTLGWRLCSRPKHGNSGRHSRRGCVGQETLLARSASSSRSRSVCGSGCVGSRKVTSSTSASA
jgi:hypothetical protein